MKPELEHREDWVWWLIEGVCWFITKLVKLSGREFL